MARHIPFFSVIIPTLNEAQFLPKLLTDLAAQQEKEFEVIVVDGKSEDQTVSRARGFAEKLTLSVYEVEKRNVSFQRNYGASKAHGRYFIFFDADVGMAATFLKALKEKLLTQKPDYGTT